MTTLRDLTNRHRAQQLLLRSGTQQSVAKLWPLIDWVRLDETYPDLAARLEVLVRRGQRDSSALASSYLKQARLAAGLRGTQAVIFADPMPSAQFNASLQTTSIAALKASAKNGVDPVLAMRNALTLTQGSMSRLVLNAGRQTITRTTTNDPRIIGWQRVLGGGGCDFCQMLAGRGAVYGEETVDFDAHDHCGCSAEPVYREDQVNPPSDWRPAGTRDPAEFSADVDAGRTLDQLRETLAQLERSLEKFDSPGTRARVEELRRNIAKRT